MKARLGVLTIGVDNLERAMAFYRDGLGLHTQGIVGTEFERGAVVFFDLEGGLKLALWPRENIAWDATVPRSPQSSTEFTLGHNVRTKEEVDAILAQAANAGGRIVKPGSATFWGGYAGYFQDPDGHLWEVLWNPQFLPKD